MCKRSFAGPRSHVIVVTPPYSFRHDPVIPSPILQSNHLSANQIIHSNHHVAASYAWNGWRSAVMDEVQGLEQLHAADLTGRFDWQRGDLTGRMEEEHLYNASTNDTVIADPAQTNPLLKSSSQIDTTNLVACSNDDTSSPSSLFTAADADAVWASMLVRASLTVDQLALTAAARLGLKPAMLARLTPRTTSISQTQTTKSNRNAPSHSTHLAGPLHTSNREPPLHNTTNQQQPSTSSSSTMSNPVNSSSLQIRLDKLGKAVVIKSEGTVHTLLSHIKTIH